MKEGWTYKKLGEVCQSDLGKTLNQSKDTGALRPYLCAINILWDKIDLSTLKQTKFEDSELERYSVRKGDLLVCEGGDIGRAAIWDKEEPIQYQNALHRIRFNEEIYPRFCLLYLRSLKQRGILDHKYAKGVTILHLVKSSLLSIPMPVPSIAEQQQIVSELDLLSDVIEKRKNQIEELDKLAHSIFYDMFGDPVTNEKGWEKKKYEEFGSVLGGYAFKSNDFVDDGVPVLKIGNINTGVLKLSDVCFYPYNIKLKNYEVKPGDLTISLTGTTGKDDYGNVCLIPSIYPVYYLNQRNAILKIKDGCNNFYLQYVFKQKSFKIELTKNNHGIRQANILNKDILGLSIPFPPLALQQEFAAKVEAIEQMKAKVRQSLKESEELFNSRMDYYFN